MAENLATSLFTSWPRLRFFDHRDKYCILSKKSRILAPSLEWARTTAHNKFRRKSTSQNHSDTTRSWFYRQRTAKRLLPKLNRPGAAWSQTLERTERRIAPPSDQMGIHSPSFAVGYRTYNRKSDNPLYQCMELWCKVSWLRLPWWKSGYFHDIKSQFPNSCSVTDHAPDC